MELKFRALRADEIDVRVAKINEKGCQLLLYKDARCDMNILDETVGPMNWMRNHSRDNANCVVSLWDDAKKQWIEKEDTGTESNTEKEKGLASDSFKRACVNWGIGRELYTSPFIWIKAECLRIVERNGKKTTDDRFCVEQIKTEGGVIKWLAIRNATKKMRVFTWPIEIQKDAPNRETVEQRKPKEQTQKPACTQASDTSVNPPICADCGCVIAPYGNRTAQQMARAAKDKFGRVLCLNCAKEESARIEESAS